MRRVVGVVVLLAGVLPCVGQALTVASGVQVMSHLGEPLLGRVALKDIGDLEADEVSATLGSAADFHQLGIDTNNALPGDLQFQVVIVPEGKGDSYIELRTTKPVKEPEINFPLHVSWPNNDRVNAMTILLDPPGKHS